MMIGLDMWEVFMAWVKFVREDIEIWSFDGCAGIMDFPGLGGRKL